MKDELALEGWKPMSNRYEKMNAYPVCKKQVITNYSALIKKAGRTDIFTEDELTRLFNPELYTDKVLYLYYVCCLTGPLRTGETRGLRVKQILFDRKTLVVDGFVKSKGIRIDYAKQGTVEQPKFRMVPLPDITLNLLKEHIAEHRVSEDGFIFKGHKKADKPITAWYVQDNLKRIMKKAGVEPNGRKLTVQFFRFTSILLFMRWIMPMDTVMKPVIHRTVRMIDYL
jgi:integrase